MSKPGDRIVFSILAIAGGFAGAVLFAVPRVLSAAIPDTIAARNFVLADSAGEMRALISANSHGAPSIGFLDSAGKTRTLFGIDSNGAPMLLF